MLVPDRERKHSAELVDALLAPFFVRMNNRFSIRACAVAMALRFKMPANIGMVVDFAVEDDPDRSVFVREWLLAGAQVDDAQSPMRESGKGVDVQAGFVRTAMLEDVAHADSAG